MDRCKIKFILDYGDVIVSEFGDIDKIQDELYIGAYWPSLDFKKLEDIGITAIVGGGRRNVD